MTSHDGLRGLHLPPSQGEGRANPAGKLLRSLLVVAGVACWGLAAFGALAVAGIPGDFGEGLCGVWGCLPPMQALAAMHLFWLVVLVPVGVAAGLGLHPGGAIRVGLLLAMVSAATGAVLASLDVARWMNEMPAEFHGYAGRRALYALATHTDLPTVQALCAGLLCSLIAFRRKRHPVNGKAA